MSALNGVWSDMYILEIRISKKLEKSAKVLQENLILKTWHFPSKKKTFVSALVFLVMKKNIQSVWQKILK